MNVKKSETEDEDIKREIEAIERNLRGSDIVKKLKSKSSTSIKKSKSSKGSMKTNDPFKDDDDDIFEDETVGTETEEETEEDFIDETDASEIEEEETEEETEEEEETKEETEEEEEAEEEAEPEPTIREIPDDEKDMIIAYNKNCSRCSYLIGWAKDHYDDCHYMNGNEACPAQMVKIVLGFPINKAARAIAKSLLNSDVIKSTKQMRHLKQADPAIQSRVMKEVKKLMAIGDPAKFPVVDDLPSLILKRKPKRKPIIVQA